MAVGNQTSRAVDDQKSGFDIVIFCRFFNLTDQSLGKWGHDCPFHFQQRNFFSGGGAARMESFTRGIDICKVLPIGVVQPEIGQQRKTERDEQKFHQPATPTAWGLCLDQNRLRRATLRSRVKDRRITHGRRIP